MMKKLLLFTVVVLTLNFCVSCEVAQPDPQVTEQGESFTGGGNGGGSQENGSYEFTFTCSTPGSEPSTVPIPAGTEKCQEAFEYYAKTYGCNDVGNFNAATCRLCNDCGLPNYCALCQ